MRRNGNYHYRVETVVIKDVNGASVDEPFTLIIHRGVSQGGKKLSSEKLLRFWQKKGVNPNLLPTLSFFRGEGKYGFCIASQGLKAMRDKNFVIAICSHKCREIFTPSRIKKFGVRIDGIPANSANAGVPRRGGLQL